MNTEVLHQVSRLATHRERKRLELASSVSVVGLRRIRYDDQGPLVHESCVFALHLLAGLRVDAPIVASISVLALQQGIPVGRATERIGTVACPAGVAVHLGIARGATVLQSDRLVRMADGRPLEWCVSVFAPR